MNKINWRVSVVALLGWLLLGAPDVFSATNAVKKVVAPVAPPPKNLPPAIPDFTQGGKKDDFHDWTLGATGLRGWIYGSKGATADARQILVTAVATNSPADGKFLVGDVILGVGGQPFSYDARISLAKAIAAAESEAGGGKIQLLRWRMGKVEAVDLRLKVLGTYSATAPYDCPKSKKVFELGCAAIAKRGLNGVTIANDWNALALLASAKAEYRPLLAAYAKQVAENRFQGYVNWDYGYANIFLAEYVLATGDQTVAAGLKRIALEIVQSQSGVGTWGHSPSLPNGSIGGYGCMNQPGLSLTISMVLAREAGVKDPALDRAITKASGFLRWFAGKGAIPYGDHQPWMGHDDNGKCSSAAVLFDLLGDREAVEFFSKMAAASYNERERGHTGNYFNILWALPAVIRCGPLTSGAYLKEQSWYYDLARASDGSVVYPGEPQGEQEYGGHKGWDCTGSFLVAFAAPQKSLYLTGKKGFSVPPLNAKETAEVIAAGRDFSAATESVCYDGRTTEQLLADLSNWSPIVRARSVQSLAKRQGDFMPQILKLLGSSNRNARYGACQAISSFGARADAAAPQLRALLKDSDPWTQNLACLALQSLSPQVRKASLPDFMNLAVAVNPADPRRIVQRAACNAIFDGTKGVFAGTDLATIDRRILFPAVESILKNEDGAARAPIARIYGKLTDPELAMLLPAIYKATEKIAPSDEMFAATIRFAGLDVMSKQLIREAMPLCATLTAVNWGGDPLKSLDYLKRYGIHARPLLPQLRVIRDQYKVANPNLLAKIDKSLAEIQTNTVAPQLVSLSECIEKLKAAK